MSKVIKIETTEEIVKRFKGRFKGYNWKMINGKRVWFRGPVD